jgi:hypothetical protein
LFRQGKRRPLHKNTNLHRTSSGNDRTGGTVEYSYMLPRTSLRLLR